MRHADHQRATFLLSQKLDDAACHGHRIEIFQRLEIVRRNQTNRTDSKTKQTNANAAHFLNHVSLDAILERAAMHIIVGGNDVEISELQRLGQRFDTIIKLVIADGARVVTDHRHRFVFDFAFIKIEVRRALQDVAGIN